MAEEREIEEFLQRRQGDYEALMVGKFHNVKTFDELRGHHVNVKVEITTQLSKKWKEEMKTIKMPNNLSRRLPQMFEEIYGGFKTNFAAKERGEPNEETPAVGVFSTFGLKESEEEEEIPIEIPVVKSRGVLSRFNLEEQKEEKVAANVFSTSEQKRNLEDERREDSSGGNGADYAIGIDLGTTMCCVAVLIDDRVKIIPNRVQASSGTTPSVVAFHEDGNIDFGTVAKERAYRFPETTIFDVKRMIGRSWTDDKLQGDKKVWPFELVKVNDNPKIKFGSKTRYPHEVSSILLARFRVMADEFLHLPIGTIRKAVITVPAYFSEPQRRATHEAAEVAGLEVLNILSEPTAASIAYSWEKRLPGTQRNLIYDLGGGTFDVAITMSTASNVNILGVHGDTHLGGQDIDQILIKYCLEEFKRTEGIDILQGRNSDNKPERDKVKKALARLRLQCEKVKERLSSTTVCSVEIDSIAANKDLSVEITRKKLEELCTPLIQGTLQIVDEALKDAHSKGIQGKKDIDQVILIGGTTRMPLVERMVQSYFNGKQVCKHINPDEAVAFGAAIQADMLNRRRQSRNSISIEIQDVIPLGLGIECLDDEFNKMIPKNSTIPCNFEEIYHTSDDNQTTLRFIVRQGESDKASDNILLGEFFFNGIPPSPAEQEHVKVTMTINGMGILQVRAKSLTNDKENCITITTAHKLGMNDEEMRRLRKEIEQLLLLGER